MRCCRWPPVAREQHEAPRAVAQGKKVSCRISTWFSLPQALAAVITHPTDTMALFIPPLSQSPQSGHKLTS